MKNPVGILSLLLDKFDLIDGSYVVPEKFLGLAGFLCGALGVAIIDSVISLLRRKFSS